MLKDLYVESEEVQLWDLLFLTTSSWEMSQGVVNQGNRSQKRRKKECTQGKVASPDIRTMFSPVAKKRSTKPEKNVVILV